jgi:hypothetical protein
MAFRQLSGGAGLAVSEAVTASQNPVITPVELRGGFIIRWCQYLFIPTVWPVYPAVMTAITALLLPTPIRGEIRFMRIGHVTLVTVSARPLPAPHRFKVLSRPQNSVGG